MPDYSGETIATASTNITNTIFPMIQYNTEYDADIKNRKQYFGLSSWVGVDIDAFTFKGNAAYTNNPSTTSRGFHLDSRLCTIGDVKVDGESGYNFVCVDKNARTAVLDGAPIIGTEAEMEGSIYEYLNLRKFTVYFYGGFDGWDIYRKERTNTDKYKMTRYQGYFNEKSGEGYSFSKIADPEALGLNQNGITSDWYAYLAAIRKFANPEETDINVFATPRNRLR